MESALAQSVAENSSQVLSWLRHSGDSAEPHLLGKGYQAWVYLYDTPFGRLVVKRAHPAPVLRALGRVALGHEHRVYRRLTGKDGIPHTYGLLDDEHLVLEYIEGQSLRRCEHHLQDRDRFFRRFRETIEAMHEAGVAHGDLKRKDNILVGPDERPYLIDFGVARIRPTGDSPLRRWLYEWCRQSDYNAWVKLKYQRREAVLSVEDQAIYRPLLLERAARAVRIPLRALTLRRWRKSLKRRRQDTDSG